MKQVKREFAIVVSFILMFSILKLPNLSYAAVFISNDVSNTREIYESRQFIDEMNNYMELNGTSVVEQLQIAKARLEAKAVY